MSDGIRTQVQRFNKLRSNLEQNITHTPSAKGPLRARRTNGLERWRSSHAGRRRGSRTRLNPGAELRFAAQLLGITIALNFFSRAPIRPIWALPGSPRGSRGPRRAAGRAPGCGAPGCCSQRSGTAAPCGAAASRSPAPAACSSAARVPTSPPSASAAPAQARGRAAATATTEATAPRRPWARARRPAGAEGCAQAEAGAGGPRSHGSARAATGGLTRTRPPRPLAMAPWGSLPVAERNCGPPARGREPRPAQSPAFETGKLYWQLSSPATGTAAGALGKWAGQRNRARKRPGRSRAEPEVMGLGGAEAEREATGSERGLYGARAQSPTSAGGRAVWKGVESWRESGYWSFGVMDTVAASGLRRLPLPTFKKFSNFLHRAHFLAPRFRDENTESPSNGLPRFMEIVLTQAWDAVFWCSAYLVLLLIPWV